MNPLHKLALSVFFFIALLWAQVALAQNAGDWILKKDNKGIKVYVRDAQDSRIKELKFTTEIKASLSAIASLLTDIPHFDEWSYGSKNTRLVKRVSATEFFYYTEVEFPWPLSNRDLVLQSKMWQDKKDLAIHQHISSAHSMLPIQGKLVRMEYADIRWEITPLSKGLVRLDYLMKSDPGGNLPAWMINMATDQGPMQTIIKFKDLLQKEKYRNAKLPFIQEPL